MSGGSLLSRETRKRIEAVFGVPVIDLYSCWEFGNIAWECSRHSGYHMNADSLIIELVRDGKRVSAGERGELIITSLDAYAMPLIRYQIGDLGLLGNPGCPCGRGLPLLERIEGRSNDGIRLADGKILHDYPITILLRSIPGILQFRLVQETLGEFKVDLVTGEGFGPGTVERAEKGLREVLGPDITLQFRMVNEIPPDPSGKIRSVLSRVE
jgi:phenylacetate-CoA ligase